MLFARLGKNGEENTALVTRTINRELRPETAEAARIVTSAVTSAYCRMSRPRDDAAADISDSSATEVEFAVPRHASRHVTGMPQPAVQLGSSRHPGLLFQLLPHEGMFFVFGSGRPPPALLPVACAGGVT